MDFSYRFLKEGDYENTLVKWWKDWRWPSPPSKSMLPQDGLCGIMIVKGDIDVCAGFLFLTNSKSAWVEYVISNFEYKETDRHEALLLLIDTLSMIARDKGCELIFTSLKNDSLIEKYEKSGYIKGSDKCTEMIKIL